MRQPPSVAAAPASAMPPSTRRRAGSRGAFSSASGGALGLSVMAGETPSGPRCGLVVEARQIRLHLLQGVDIEVDHVTGRIETVLDVLADRRVQAEVAQVELGGVERRGQVVVAVGGKDLQMRVAPHRVGQVTAHVRRLREALVLALPVPVAVDDAVVVGQVGVVAGVVQGAGGVLVEGGQVGAGGGIAGGVAVGDRKSTRLNSSHPSISYAVFCLKKKKNTRCHHTRQ